MSRPRQNEYRRIALDRQLDTSGHVLGEVGLCDRLSEDLVTTPSLQVSFLTGLSVSSQMS